MVMNVLNITDIVEFDDNFLNQLDSSVMIVLVCNSIKAIK